jgi:hypothetical protein
LLSCATTPKVDWNSRVGNYMFDQVVLELGPPDKSAKLNDGTTVAEWLTHRGYSRGSIHYLTGLWIQQYQEPPAPEYYLRLTFGPEGKLQAWKRIVK